MLKLTSHTQMGALFEFRTVHIKIIVLYTNTLTQHQWDRWDRHQHFSSWAPGVANATKFCERGSASSATSQIAVLLDIDVDLVQPYRHIICGRK
jgi:hypothetical protein